MEWFSRFTKRWISMMAFVNEVFLLYQCNSKKNGGGIFNEKTSCVTVV